MRVSAPPPTSTALQLLAALALTADPAPPVNRDEIFAAWRARQERIRTFHVEWEGEAFFAQGSLFWSPTATQAAQGKELPPAPAADTTFKTHFSLDVDLANTRVRFEGHRPMWHSEKGIFLEHDFANVSRDGLWFRYLGEEPREPQLSRRGTIQAHSDVPDSRDNDVWPWLLVHSPLEPRYSILGDFNEWSVLPGMETVGSGPQIVLERRTKDFSAAVADSGKTEQLLVHPAHDFRIDGYRKLFGERMAVQVDFEYDAGGERPLGWNRNEFSFQGEPQLKRRVRSRAVTYEPNATVPDAQFMLEFPVDSWADDQVAGQ